MLYLSLEDKAGIQGKLQGSDNFCIFREICLRWNSSEKNWLIRLQTLLQLMLLVPVLINN